MKRADIIAELRANILRLEGFRPASHAGTDLGLGSIKDAFPNATFPLGAIHEFLSARAEDAAATCGFIAGLLTPLMGTTGTSLWISSSRTLFPPALKTFGIQPDRFIFIDLLKEKDVMWAMDEALKCSALSAVIGEMQEVSFINSRRLQLAVEQSQVTGFILRHNSRNPNITACISRWRITSLPSDRKGAGMEDDLPGVGFPRWQVELLRMRNGRSGIWDITWKEGGFHLLNDSVISGGEYLAGSSSHPEPSRHDASARKTA
ncbi:MAG TPA: Error-prone repair protein ImuA [Chryseosolibacter sp.]